jgi:hypothetical protein
MNGTLKPRDVHFHPGPECAGGLVVPCVNDATPDMFAFRRSLLDARSFANVDGQFAFGPVEGHCQDTVCKESAREACLWG